MGKNKSWVAGHLAGGLGNRLFQHAAAAGLAEKWNRPLVFHRARCEATGHGPLNSIFKLLPDVPHVYDGKSEMLGEKQNHVFTYSPFPDKDSHPSKNICVDGFRQTDLYFPSKGIHVKFESALDQETMRTLLETYKLTTQEERKTTWFLHMRFGDYTILPHHQIDIGAYYSKAIQLIPQDHRILVFSDEATQYKDFLLKLFTSLGRTVTIVENENEVESLYLMAYCWGGAVVANSTYSWWGAYFAKQRCPGDYTAIYPAVWGAGLPEAKHIVPSWGTKITL